LNRSPPAHKQPKLAVTKRTTLSHRERERERERERGPGVYLDEENGAPGMIEQMKLSA